MALTGRLRRWIGSLTSRLSGGPKAAAYVAIGLAAILLWPLLFIAVVADLIALAGRRFGPTARVPLGATWVGGLLVGMIAFNGLATSMGLSGSVEPSATPAGKPVAEVPSTQAPPTDVPLTAAPTAPPTPTLTPLPSPTETATPTDTPAPTPEPTPEPTPAPQPTAASVTVSKVSFTATVAAGSTATLKIKTLPGAYCTITVTYKSGPSTAQGLDPKTAGSTGTVSWSWLVGARTTPGSWPVDVACSLKGSTGYLNLYLKVT